MSRRLVELHRNGDGTVSRVYDDGTAELVGAPHGVHRGPLDRWRMRAIRTGAAGSRAYPGSSGDELVT